MTTQWIATPEEDPTTGDLIISFPDDMIKQLEWQAGDTLRFSDTDNGIVIKNISLSNRSV